MGSRLSVIAGLLAGLLVAGALLVAFVFVGPDPVRPSASPAPSDSAAASASAALTPSPAASGPVSPPLSGPVSGPVSGPAGSPGVTENFHIGQPAPPLVVPQVGGGTIDLANLKGKPVWVNFMQTTCPPCLDEFPLMNAYGARYADEGLVIVAVDIKEQEGDVALFASTLNATFPMGLDSDGKAQQAWGAYGLPVHFWIDKDGIVRDGALGGIGADVMARGLQTILPGVVVTPEG